MNVEEWLRGLGLSQFAVAFRDNDIDAELLPDLTTEDLISLGIASVGHRRKLLNAIAALSARPSTEPVGSSPAAAADPPLSRTDAERRQLTVMFCDLIGSTALAARLDPEDLREVIGAYHAAVADEVRRCGGIVAKYMGDGVLAYFGYPLAHEDDAERSILAGLAIAERIAKLETRVRLETRLGIATGLVVVGDLIGSGDAQERGVVGETPNLAARLQGLADPNAVLISATTRQLVGDLFVCQDLGSAEIKGFDAPVPMWRVLRPSAVESRFEALRGEASTPLVGRDEELDLLLRRWAQSRAGEGQVVLLSGEPGIGKSRLTAALQERLHGQAHVQLRYFCSPHHQDSPLYPFTVQLERAAGLEREDSPDTKLGKLEALTPADAHRAETVALFADVLGIVTGDRYPPLSSDPQRRRELTLQALLGQLEALARQGPILLLFEDAHWADQTSLELLDRAVEWAARSPVLLVITFRPEFDPPWREQAHISSVLLTRLAARETEAVVRGVTAGKPLPPEILDRIIERTDGIPLFVEELTKTLLEGGLLTSEDGRYVLSGPLPSLAIPSSLHASLMARLDRLAPVKEVAQIGAAIGREFSYELVAAVARRSAQQLGTALDQLTDSGLVFRRGTPPRASYMFKHALVQDAAYGSMLRGIRQELHARIAGALETHSAELIDSQPELLAYHYAEAGLVEKSIEYWGRAGRRSAARSAGTEAAAQFQKGLDQLALMPDSRERNRQELEFHSALAAVLIAVKGFAAPETGHATARALELWERLGSPTEFLHLPFGQSFYHVVRSEFDLAARCDENLLRLSDERSDTAGLVMGHHSAGRTLFFRGRFAQSEWHQEQALSRYGQISRRSFVGQSGFVVHVGILGFSGLALFCLGFPEQALARYAEAVAVAQRAAHPPSLAASLSMGSRLLSLTDDDAALAECVDQLVAVTTEHGFPFWGSMGTVLHGWLKVRNGDAAEGISLIRSGSAAHNRTGATVWEPLHICLLARAHEIVGKVEEALVLFDEALQVSAAAGECCLAAELNRHKGNLLLNQGHPDTAEALYRTALAIATEQEAKIWELRAAAGLARLWGNQGRRMEARDLLAPVYGWFTEGFDTADLKSAKHLLDELA